MEFLLGGFTKLQLDIVGFLAFLGDGLVLVHYQAASLSNFTYLPRLIPAPNALIRATRPTDLPTAKGKVVGVFSGNYRDHVNQIAYILHDDRHLDRFTVRSVQIDGDDAKPLKTKPFGPLTMVACVGCLIAIINLVLAVRYDDGMALLATIFLSFLSTIVGIGNKSSLRLAMRVHKSNVPPGDVVIVEPQGSFIVVRCHENIARQLYFAPEDIRYNVENAFIYRFLSLSGTLLLMGGVITLANSKTELQLSFAASYMVINAAYWFVAATPARVHWDLSTFAVKEIHLGDTLDAEGHPPERETWLQRVYRSFGNEVGPPKPTTEDLDLSSRPKPNFTQALWQASFISGSTKWARLSNSAPQTPVWDKWLEQVDEKIRDYRAVQNPHLALPDRPAATVEGHRAWVIPNWDAKAAWDRIEADLESQNAPPAQNQTGPGTQASATGLQVQPAMLQSRSGTPESLRSS